MHTQTKYLRFLCYFAKMPMWTQRNWLHTDDQLIYNKSKKILFWSHCKLDDHFYSFQRHLSTISDSTVTVEDMCTCVPVYAFSYLTICFANGWVQDEVRRSNHINQRHSIILQLDSQNERAPAMLKPSWCLHYHALISESVYNWTTAKTTLTCPHRVRVAVWMKSTGCRPEK